MKKILYFFQFLLVFFLVFPLAFLPVSLAQRFGESIGKLGFRFWKSRRTIAIEAIEKTIEAGCLPSTLSPEDTTMKTFMNLGRSFMEIIKVYLMGGRDLIDPITIHGIENLHEARSFKKGVLIITGHYSNWELLALAFGRKISHAFIVARKQNNPFLNFLIEKIRQRFGNTIIYKEGALKKIMSELKNNNVVGILYDQCVVEDEGIIVDFMCRPAWTMKIPVLLSRKTGAPILPIFLKRTSSGYLMVIDKYFFPDKELGLAENVSQMNKHIETHIKDDPAQWLWIHRRWKRTDS